MNGDAIHPYRFAYPFSSIILTLLLIACVAASAAAQTSPATATTSSGATFNAPSAMSSPVSDISTRFQEAQNPLYGSVPQGQVTPGEITITPLDAIERGLKYNLALIFSQKANQTATGARLKALGDVLPNFNARVAESVQQNNLAAFGLSIPGFPQIVGPFGLFDARIYGTANVDLKNISTYQSRVQELAASKLDYQNARDLVVLVVGGTYMQALAAEARVTSVQAQLDTANTLLQRAQDMFSAGTVPNIDVLRAQVEQQVEQQRLLAARNTWETQKLTLGRMIGLPAGQQFKLVNNIPVTPVAPLTLDQALQRAYANRPDFAAAKAQLQAAELAQRGAHAERLPSLMLSGDYGTLGRRPTESHGTFTATAGLKIPIFQGGRIRGDEIQADALLQRRQDEVADLHARIEYEIRTAMLDLQSAADQVKVAQSSAQLAHEALEQAQDRFRAGVSNNLEVVQAQESVAMTDENFINSTFVFNVAKLSLARSLGIAERAVIDFLGGKP